MEEYDLNEANCASAFVTQKTDFLCFSPKNKEIDGDAYVAQNFSQKNNLLMVNENKNNLLNLKYNNYYKNHNYNDNVINNLNIIHSNDNINYFPLTNKNNNNNLIKNVEKEDDSTNAVEKPKTLMPYLAPASKPILNPFKEKVKMLIKKRSSAETSGNLAPKGLDSSQNLKSNFPATSFFPLLQSKNVVLSTNSKDSTEDDVSSNENCVFSSKNAAEGINSFNSMFADPFKYNKLLKQQINNQNGV